MKTIITLIVLSIPFLLLVGCKEKDTSIPEQVRSCYECELSKESDPGNGMAWIITKKTATYCNRTATDIDKIQKDGTGIKEELEFGKIIRYNQVTRCKIN